MLVFLQIILGGMLLPWIGYFSGWVFSYLLNQPNENKLAITIETGVQNTGISIFLLRTCLPQPDSDITTGWSTTPVQNLYFLGL